MNKMMIWGISALVSVALLGLVIMQVDFAEALIMVRQTSWNFLILALICLFAEGVITSFRLSLFAQKKSPLVQAFRANAWYVLLLIILPARLGEVAAVLVLERYLGQKRAAGVMSIITQRLYDVMILGVIFLIALLGLGSFINIEILGIMAFIFIGVALFILVRMEMFLTLGATCLQRRQKKSRNKFLHRMTRLILQARIYNRHGLRKRIIPEAIFLSLLKWVSNISALVFLFMALHLELGLFENLTVASSYNFLAIIPLQTIGGIGVGEAGLALLLGIMGLSVSMAAGAGLMIRFVILLFPFIFFVLIWAGTGIKERMTSQ